MPDSKTRAPPQHRPANGRDDIVVVPMNQPVPPGPGLAGWLQIMRQQDKKRYGG